MFRACSIESFSRFFKNENSEIYEDSELELRVKVNISKKISSMKDIEGKVCDSLCEVLKVNNLRLLRLDEQFTFIFGAKFQGAVTPLNRLKEASLEKLKACGVTEMKLKDVCLYGLDGKDFNFTSMHRCLVWVSNRAQSSLSFSP